MPAKQRASRSGNPPAKLLPFQIRRYFPAGPLLSIIDHRVKSWSLGGICDLVAFRSDRHPETIRRQYERMRQSGYVLWSIADLWATALHSHLGAIYGWETYDLPFAGAERLPEDTLQETLT